VISSLRRLSPCFFGVALLFAGGCDRVEEQEYTNIASFCASTGNSTDPAKFNLAVEIDFGICLSSSCDTLIETSCDSEVVGSEIKLSGRALVESKTRGACTDDCGSAGSQCNLELDPGTYLITADGVELEYTLGSEAACTEL
jgi:hypothetical protein